MQKISCERKRPGRLVPGACARSAQLTRCTVKSVTDHRMPDRRHVYSNLMSAAGIDLYLDQTELAEGTVQPPEHGIVRNGVATATPASGHSYAAHAVTADAGGDGASIFLGPSVYECNIGFLHFTVGELCRKLAVGIVVLRYQNQPAGLLVKPMHDARPHLASDAGQSREMVQ